MVTLAQVILAGQREAALKAIEQGTFPKPAPGDTVGPLLAAVLQDWQDVVEALLKRGADPDESDSTGYLFPLYVAIRAGNPDIVSQLVKAGADVNFRNRQHGRSALWYAAQSGLDGIVQVLLDSGADPGLEDAEGVTPLEVARAQGHGEAVALLERRGAENAPRQPYRPEE